MWSRTSSRSRSIAARAPAKARAGPRAFTLLEVLVAMAVLSVALMALYQSFASTVHVNTATRGLWRAIVWVNRELARAERGPVPAVAVAQGEFPPEHVMAGYAWQREVVDEEPVPGIRVRKVQLELRWDSAGVTQRYRGQVYVRPN